VKPSLLLSPASARVTPQLMARVQFTDHAIERFATRAGLTTRSRQIVEPIVRSALLEEGLLVRDRPRWAPSHNTADLYLQLADWMLFIGMRSERRLDGYAIVTAVSRGPGVTWPRARRRRYIATPPPVALVRRRRTANPLLRILAGLGARVRPRDHGRRR